MKPTRAADRNSVRHRTILPRFRDAFRGLVQAYREEPNIRFHVFAASCVFLAGGAVKLEGWETAYLSITIALVLLAELVNTAVERTVDFAAGGRRHPLAGQAKEVAAGAVLLSALHATFAACFVFLVRRGGLVTLGAVLSLVERAPWLFALPLLAGVSGLIGGGKDE